MTYGTLSREGRGVSREHVVMSSEWNVTRDDAGDNDKNRMFPVNDFFNDVATFVQKNSGVDNHISC